MKLDHALLALAGVLLLVGTVATAVGVATVSGFGQEQAFDETSIRSADITDPRCADLARTTVPRGATRFPAAGS